ncbi:trypsin inhibitor ClTI-1-like [Ascaphus truei]|uniref:trypsin inhibitor ClTI-1-like n=1 Tax=Ascaphus truei TaxID=8439 RepID=UPI003F5A146E
MKLYLSCAMLIYMIVTVTWSVPEIEGADPPNCDTYNTRSGCPRNFAFLCGTDGVTYANECVLCHIIRDSGQDIQIESAGEC